MAAIVRPAASIAVAGLPSYPCPPPDIHRGRHPSRSGWAPSLWTVALLLLAGWWATTTHLAAVCYSLGLAPTLAQITEQPLSVSAVATARAPSSTTRRTLTHKVSSGGQEAEGLRPSAPHRPPVSLPAVAPILAIPVASLLLAGAVRHRSRRPGPPSGTARAGGLSDLGPPPPPAAPSLAARVKAALFGRSDRAFQRRLTQALEEEVGVRATEDGFPGMVGVFHALNRANRQPQQLQDAGYRVLLSLFPKPFLRGFRRFLEAMPGGSGGWFAARHAAALMTVPPVLEWLVGECVVEDARPEEWNGAPDRVPANVAEWMAGSAGRPAGYQQVGVVKRCRVLEEANCSAVCLNGCKVPTERLFAEEFGLPVTLRPNFQTMECRFVFGAPAPPPDQDPAFAQPCLATCASARFLSRLALGPERSPPAPAAACRPGAARAALAAEAARLDPAAGPKYSSCSMDPPHSTSPQTDPTPKA